MSLFSYISFMYEIVLPMLLLEIEYKSLAVRNRCLFPFLLWNNLEKSLTSSQPHRVPSLRRPLFRINFDYRFNFVWCVSFRVSVFRGSLTKLNSLCDRNRIESNKIVVADERPVAFSMLWWLWSCSTRLGAGACVSFALDSSSDVLLQLARSDDLN